MELTERVAIILAYGTTLEKRRLVVGREADLPFPKELIRQALSEELANPTYPEIVDALEAGFVELEAFLPDGEFELVSQFYETFAEAEAMIQKGDPESVQKGTDLIASTPVQAIEIQREVVQRRNERLKEIQNMRQRRGEG